MPDRAFELDVFRDLLEEASSIGRFAEDENAFRQASPRSAATWSPDL